MIAKNDLKIAEAIIDPELDIVDAHHHLWFVNEQALEALDQADSILARGLAPNLRRHARYLFDELLADLHSGHNIRATVFVDAGAMYRANGPEELKSIGEVEFVNGVAAMAASGAFGDVKACAGIVGNVDLRLGDAVEEILRVHLQVGGGRYRGIRCSALTAHDADSTILGPRLPHLLLDGRFRAGFKWLHTFGLSFDVFILEPQLPELIDLARAFPETQIVLNHVGTPVGVGRYAGKRGERFAIWRENIQTLSTCENVSVKLGGLGLPLAGFQSFPSSSPASSVELAGEWKPYIETCIEAFGADRCMFESNFPIDSAVGTYAVLWNAFKRLAAGASKAEKTALFSGTATRVYRLDI
jgi:predicted TIM-barrel fold metal-dependent hydrolase